MKQFTFFLILACFSISCRREYAHFQQSNYPTYATKKVTLKPETIKLNLAEMPLIASANDLTLAYVAADTPQQNLLFENVATIEKKVLNDKGKRRKKKATIGKKIDDFIERNFSNNDNKSRAITKRSQKSVPLNSTIYSGFITLGLAILLALISLKSLSIVFGIAAVIFLFMGFKRYFRKLQRRDIFR